MGLGVALINQHQVVAALTAFRQAITLVPNDPQAHNNLATTYLLLGDVAAGRRSLQKALELDPDYGSAHYNLGCLLEKEGKFTEALAEMQLALRANNNDAVLQAKIVQLRQSISQQLVP
jgi:Flp pilus assembly protein TadD